MKMNHPGGSDIVSNGNNSRVSRRSVLRGAAVGAAAAVAGGRILRAEETPGSDSPAIRNNRIRQTVCQWCYKKSTLEELCENSVRIGLKGVDLVNPESFAVLKKHGLECSMTVSHKIEKGLNRKENWDECLGLIRKGIEANAAAGFANVICFSGNRAGMSEDEGMKNCAEALKQVVGLAEEKKVTIQMELLNSKVNHKDYMCDRSDWGVGLVKMVGSERFKLLYDIYHMQIMEGDVIATIKKNHQYFGHYHTAGVPGRHELDTTQELYYPAIVEAIIATGYKGFLGQEFIPVRDPMTSLAQAARLCDV